MPRDPAVQFVPLWTSIIDGPSWKVLDLPPDLFRFWALCLLCAQKHDFVDGTLPEPRTLAHWINMGRLEAEGLLARLVAAGLVDCIDGGHRVHDWPDWRLVKDSGAVQRQREWRAARKAERDKERDKKRDVSRNGHGPVTDSFGDVTPQHTTDNRQQATDSIQRGDAPAPASARSPEDQKQFDEAVAMLAGSLQTQPIALELSRRSDLSEYRAIKGWQWIVAARALGSGKKRSIDYMLGIARNATADEFLDHGRPRQAGGDVPYRSRPDAYMPLPPSQTRRTVPKLAPGEAAKILGIKRERTS